MSKATSIEWSDPEDRIGSDPSERTVHRGTELGGLFPQSFTEDYLFVEEGQGPLVRDENGNWYIDAVSGSKNVNIGHGRDEIATAAFDQQTMIAYVSPGYANRPACELSQTVTEFTPPEFNHVWLVSGGSLANESAFKMARQYHVEQGAPRKHKILSRSSSFHGNTAGAMAVSGSPRFMSIMDPLFPDYPKAPSGTPYRCNFCDGDGGQACGVRCANEVKRLIRSEGAENVAAFIVEPVNSLTNAGAYPHEGYFKRVREICDEYDVLLIADEIMTGFGRTGRPFAMEHWDVTPDIITAGKGLSSGYAPHGAVLPHDRVVDVFKDTWGFAHSHTFCNNPTAAAISKAVLEYTAEHDVLENARTVGEHLGDRLRELYQYESVGDVRGKGMMYGIEFVRDRDSKEPPREPALPSLIHREGLNRGILTSTERGHIDREHGVVTIVAPPLTISESTADVIVDRLHGIFSTVETELNLTDGT